MPHIAPALSTPSTYFIFRDDGIEVRFGIKNNMIFPSHNLTPKESNFIRNNIILKKENMPQSNLPAVSETDSSAPWNDVELFECRECGSEMNSDKQYCSAKCFNSSML